MFCLHPFRFVEWEGWDISRMWNLLYGKEGIKGFTLCFVVPLQFKLSGWSQQKYLFDNIQYFKWSTWSPGMMESKERLSDIAILPLNKVKLNRENCGLNYWRIDICCDFRNVMFVVFVHISKRPASHVSTMFEYLRNTNIILWSKKFKKFSCKSIPVGITAHYLSKSFEI